MGKMLCDQCVSYGLDVCPFEADMRHLGRPEMYGEAVAALVHAAAAVIAEQQYLGPVAQDVEFDLVRSTVARDVEFEAFAAECRRAYAAADGAGKLALAEAYIGAYVAALAASLRLVAPERFA